MRLALILGITTALSTIAPAAEDMDLRTWTDVSGAKVEAEYISSTDTEVTLRGKNLQNMKVPLDKLSEADQDFIKETVKAAKEANLIKLSFKGEIMWSLDKKYGSMSWMTEQNAELWTWDEEEKKPKEKLAKFKVTYDTSYSSVRRDMEGYYQTDEVEVDKDARLVILAKLRFTMNNKPVEAEDVSIPMSIPKDASGTVKLVTARASAR